MKKVIALMLTAVMCTGILTACGNGKDETSGGAGSPAGTESGGAATDNGTASTETAGNAAGTVAGGNILTVGTNAEFPPFEYVGDDGEPDGFDIALIKAIGEKLGMEVKVENMEFNALAGSIGTKIDAAIAGMTVTEERAAAVDFSDTYYEAVQSVIVSVDSDIATAADLENKTIGVQLETTGNYIADKISGATVQAYNKGVDAVNDLINGRVDAVIIDKNPAAVFAEKFSDKVVALDGDAFAFEAEYYAIALPKGSDLTAQVNQVLADLKADGTFDALVAQYIGGEE